MRGLAKIVRHLGRGSEGRVHGVADSVWPRGRCLPLGIYGNADRVAKIQVGNRALIAAQGRLLS